MTIRRRAALRILAGAAVLIASAVTFPVVPHANAATPTLAAHRAVYDLKLAESRGKQSLQAVKGRILYDLSRDGCRGYALRFRQVTELSPAEGSPVLSDLTQTYWEDASGKSFRFTSRNKLGEEEAQDVQGEARRSDAALTVELTKPEKKRFETATAVFPADHMRRVIAAAQQGKSLLEIAAYDGSENGEKIYNTLTVIGQPIAAGQGELDAASSSRAMADQRRWPVTISYFERTGSAGEQTPAYSLSFEVFENGISRALKLDYGDFVLVGELTSLEVGESSACP